MFFFGYFLFQTAYRNFKKRGKSVRRTTLESPGTNNNDG